MTTIADLHKLVQIAHDRRVQHPGLDIRLELDLHGLHVRLSATLSGEVLSDFFVISWKELEEATLRLLFMETRLDDRIEVLRSAVRRRLGR